eukprot:scaffold25_cov190-Alexandrium_tamarense.AAC.2
MERCIVVSSAKQLNIPKRKIPLVIGAKVSSTSLRGSDLSQTNGTLEAIGEDLADTAASRSVLLMGMQQTTTQQCDSSGAS